MADFVIVGGGVYGCGLAWELAKRNTEVLLLEASEVASGASGGPGKRGVRANGRDVRELPLMRQAYTLWPTLGDEIDADIGFERTGHLMLIERQADLRAARARLWLQNRQGIPTRLVEKFELRELEPDISDAVFAALYCPQDGVADHTATTRGLAEAARRLGADIREEVTVFGLERHGERAMAVITDQEERIPVSHTLFLLSNNHVPPFVQSELGVTLPVWWRLPQVIFSEPVDSILMRHLIGHAHRTLAMKRGPAGSVMISGGWRGRLNPETNLGEPQPDQVAGNLAQAIAVYPGLVGAQVHQATADRLETQTVDGIPVIDRMAEASNLFIGTGWSGHGWAIAPSVCRLLAEWAFTGEQPALLRPFGYGRFL